MPKRHCLGPKRVKNAVFGPKKFFSQIGKKMAEIWPKTFYRPNKGQKCGFWSRIFLVKNWPKNGQICFYGLKRVKNVVFGPPKKFQPIWLTSGQKMAKICFYGLKRVKNVVFSPEKIFSQIGQKMAKRHFLGPKRVENVVFGPEKMFSQIGQKMAEIWPKDNF